jgi:hypothetical protein
MASWSLAASMPSSAGVARSQSPRGASHDFAAWAGAAATATHRAARAAAIPALALSIEPRGAA